MAGEMIPVAVGSLPEASQAPPGPDPFAEVLPKETTQNPTPSMPQGDPFSGIDKAPSKLQQTAAATDHLDPTEAGKVVGVARQTGQAPTEVANNLKSVQEYLAKPSQAELAHTEENYPKTTQFMQNPGNYAAWNQDLSKVNDYEKTNQEHGWLASLANLAYFGVDQIGIKASQSLGFLYNTFLGYDPNKTGESIPSNPMIIPMAETRELSRKLDLPPNAPDWMIHNGMTKYFEDLAKERASESPALQDMGPAMEKVFDDVKRGDWKAVRSTDPLRIGRALATQFVVGLPELAGMVAMGPLGGAAYAGAGTAIESSVANQEKGVPADQGTQDALLKGLTSFFLMHFGTMKAIGTIKNQLGQELAQKTVGEALKASGKTFGIIVGQGAAQNAANDIIDHATGVNVKATDHILADAAEGAVSSLPLALALGAGHYMSENTTKSLEKQAAKAIKPKAVEEPLPGEKAPEGKPGAAPVVEKPKVEVVSKIPTLKKAGVVDLIANDQQAAQSRDTYLKLGEKAQEFKTKAVDPVGNSELLEHQHAGEPTENIHFPLEDLHTYYQSIGKDPTEDMEKVGAGASYQDALKTQGDVVVPMGKWVAEMAGKPEYEGLADHVRFDPDHMTTAQVEQAKVTRADIDEKMQGAVKNAATDLEKIGTDIEKEKAAGQAQPAGLKALAAKFTGIFKKAKPSKALPDVKGQALLAARFFRLKAEQIAKSAEEVPARFAEIVESAKLHLVNTTDKPQDEGIMTHLDWMKKSGYKLVVEKPDTSGMTATNRDKALSDWKSRLAAARENGVPATSKLDARGAVSRQQLAEKMFAAERDGFLRKGTISEDAIKTGTEIADAAPDATHDGILEAIRTSEAHKKGPTLSQGPLFGDESRRASIEKMKAEAKAYDAKTPEEWAKQQEEFDQKNRKEAEEAAAKDEEKNKKFADEYPAYVKRGGKLSLENWKAKLHSAEALAPPELKPEELAQFVESADHQAYLDHEGELRKELEARGIDTSVLDNEVLRARAEKMADEKGRIDLEKTRGTIVREGKNNEPSTRTNQKKPLLPKEGGGPESDNPPTGDGTSGGTGKAPDKPGPEPLDDTFGEPTSHVVTLFQSAKNLPEKRYFLKYGNLAIPVSSPKEASAKWNEFRDFTAKKHGPDFGPDSLKYDPHIVDESGKIHGRISWNGRIWKGEKGNAEELKSFSAVDNIFNDKTLKPNLNAKQQDMFPSEKGGDQPTLFQGNTESRGFMQMGGDPGKRTFATYLNENSDASTFFHELGHTFLFITHDLAERYDNPELKEDLEKFYKWAGVNKWEDLKEKHHEMFARGFEYRLWEGNVPVPGLKRLFDRFAQYLRRVYPSSAYMEHYFGHEMTPEMRGVYDRMLATQSEIDEAKRTTGYDSSIPPELPEELKRPLIKVEAAAAGKATDELTRPAMRELTLLAKKEMEKHEAMAREVAERDVNEMPVFQAMDALESEEQDPRAGAELINGGKGGVPEETYRKFEKVAVEHGYKDFGELADAIQKAGYKDEAIAQKVNDEMGKYAEKKDPPMADLAVKAIHNDKSLEAIATRNEVMKAVESGKNGPEKGVQPPALKRAQEQAAYAREKAKLILEAKPFKDAGDFKGFIKQERDAAVKAQKAKDEGKVKQAQAYRDQRLINNALFSEAYKNQKTSSKIMEGLKDFIKGPMNLDVNKGGMHRGFWNQIHGILEKAGLKQPDIFNSSDGEMTALANEMHGQAISEGKNPDLDEIANKTGMVKDDKGGWRPENLVEFVRRVDGEDQIWKLEEHISPDLLGGTTKQGTPTMSELRDLNTAIKALHHVGRNLDKANSANYKQGISESAAITAKSISDNVGQKFAVENRSPGQIANKPWIEMENPKLNYLQSVARNKLRNFLKLPDAMTKDNRILEFMAQYLDLKKEDGEVHRNVFWPLRDAAGHEVVLHVEKKEALDALMKEHYGKFEHYIKNAFDGYKVKANGVDRDFTRAELMNLFRMSGTKDGYQRLIDGYSMTPDEIQAAVNQVDPKDVKFILARVADDKKWWPRLVKNELDRFGTDLEPAELRPITYRTGTPEEVNHEGMYHRIKYDPSKCQTAFSFKNIEDLKSAVDQVNTARGYTNRRKPRVFYPPRLDDNVYNESIEEQIHDLAYTGTAQDLGRFLKNRVFSSTLSDAIGTEAARLPADQLRYMAKPPKNPATIADRIVNFGRVSTLIKNIGFRIGAGTFKYLTDNYKAMEAVNPVDWATSQARYTFDSTYREKVKAYVYKADPAMATAAQNMNYDIQGFARQWNDPFQKAKMMVYLPERLADGLVRPLLYYKLHVEAMKNFDNDEDIARNVAGQITDRKLTTGNPLYHNDWQRGGEFGKAMAAARTFQFFRFNEFWVNAKIAGLEYDKKNLGKAAFIVATSMASSFIIPGLIHWGTLEALRQGHQNMKDREKRLGGEAVQSFFGSMPVWGTFARVAEEAATSGKQGLERLKDLHLTPVDEAYIDIAKGLYVGTEGLFGKHLTEKELEVFAQGIDAAIKAPDWVQMVMFNFWDDLHGKGFDIRDLATRKKK